MDRRQFLRAISTGAVGAGTLSTTGTGQSSQTGRQTVEDQLPSRDVPTEIVTPYADKMRGNPFILDNTWIIHRFGWRTVADEGPEALERFRETVTYEFAIDDEELDETDPFWTEIQPESDGTHYYIRWEYATPPKPPGTYEFSARMNFEEPLRYPDSTGNTKIWDGEVMESCSYKVITLDHSTPTLPIGTGICETGLAEQFTDQKQQG